MSRVVLVSAGSFVSDSRVFSDFADGEFIVLTFPDEIATVTIGKNGNAIYSKNFAGTACTLSIRFLRGSEDDKYLNQRLIQQNADPNFSSTVLHQSQVIKMLGDGKGNTENDTYNLEDGILVQQPESRSLGEGDAENGIIMYNWKYRKGGRVIG